MRRSRSTWGVAWGLAGFLAAAGVACSTDSKTGDTNDPARDASTTSPPRQGDASAPDAGSGGGKSDARSGGDGGTGVDAFRDRVLSEGKPIEHVRDLTTKVGGRSAGSAGDPKAVAWALDRMNAIGLKNVHSEAVTVPHWERGEEHAELLGASEKSLAVTALGGSVATAAEGVEGELLSVATVDALNALSNDQVKGKIVFFDTAMERTKSVDGYSKAVTSRRSGAAAASKKGAAASIVRSITSATTPFPHTGDMNSGATIPAAAISTADAVVLENALAAGAVRVRLTLGCRKLDSAQSANVVGEVVGRGRPDEVVLLGAHLDSWDLATGALDDGAGIAMVLESARFLAMAPEGTQRTVRVVLYANEEAGVTGGSAYAATHKDELAKHVMALEADLGGGLAYGATFIAATSATPVLTDLLGALAPLGVTPATAGGDSGSDISPLRRSGVPVAEIQQDLTTYFDYHHSADDILDHVDPDSLRQATAAVAVFAYQIGQSAVDLGRAP